jgi:hypothetical protein
MVLSEEFVHAFACVPYPGDEALTECPCEECRWGVGRFVGKDWQTLRFKDAVSDQDDANIKLLSPTAFQYFLPGLMRLALKSHVDSFWIAMRILDRLTSSDQRMEILKEAQTAIDHLSPEQREVVAQFIERLRGDEDISPVILASAYQNVTTGNAKPYSQRELEEWVRSRLAALRKLNRPDIPSPHGNEYSSDYSDHRTSRYDDR